METGSPMSKHIFEKAMLSKEIYGSKLPRHVYLLLLAAPVWCGVMVKLDQTVSQVSA